MERVGRSKNFTDDVGPARSLGPTKLKVVQLRPVVFSGRVTSLRSIEYRVPLFQECRHAFPGVRGIAIVLEGLAFGTEQFIE